MISTVTSAIRGQQQRINSAQTALNKLAAKPGEDPQALAHKVENILERYRVKDFFLRRITEQITQQSVFWALRWQSKAKNRSPICRKNA